jgi:hypothetical protein
MLLDFPPEIVYAVSEYLDIKDLLILQMCNKTIYTILKPFMKRRTVGYLSQNNINNVCFTDLDDVSINIFVNILFFIKKCVMEGLGKIITINIFNSDNESTSIMKTRIYNSIYQKTFSYTIPSDIFLSVDFDLIESRLLDCNILDNTFIKQKYNLYNIVKKICLYRIDYKKVYDDETAVYGGVKGYLQKKKLNMITFYFFI